MAIPDNYIDKITKGNDSRMISPAADMVRVNNDNFNGADLDEVLDDVAQAIGEAGKVKTVSVNNGAPAQPDGNGNVNVVVPTVALDDAPTAGSNNAVKSGGIKTAIDQVTPTIDANGKWVIGGVTTDKDAQGPMGNTVLVNENAVGIQALIVNNVVDGGETDILSAEMGKVIRQNIMKIFNALGTYAFPEGKPVLNWGDDTPVTYTVQKTIGAGLSATGGDTDVALGDSLEVTIAITDNLYIIDNDSVVVTMGGSPVQGAWNASTMKVTIAAVTGNVVINVPSMTYVSSNLVFQLDCKNRGGQSGHWIDRIGGVDFTLGSGVTESDTGVVFDGTQNAYGTATGSLNQLASAGATIEIVAEVNSLPAPLLINPVIEGIAARLYSAGSSTQFVFMMGTSGTPTTGSFVYNGDDVGVSANKERVLIRGDVYSGAISNTTTGGPTSSQFTIGARLRTNGSTNEYLSGKIMAIRVYSSSLSESDQKKNYAIDKKRFNLA